jgi:hypothetical protein
MNYFIFLIIFFLSIIFSGLTINLETMVYGQDLSINNNTINKINQEQDSQYQSANFSYKSEPFLILNGTDFIDVPHNDTLSLHNFAITAWINTNQTNLLEPAHIVNKGGFNTDEIGENMNYGIWLSRNGSVQGGFEIESGENFEVMSTAKYNDGKWHYILLSYDGSLLRLDIDGEKQISTKNTNGAIPDTTGDQPLRIGANSLEEDKFFTGYIDEVRVWNRGLTDEEISQIYTNDTFNSTGQIVYKDFKETGISETLPPPPTTIPTKTPPTQPTPTTIPTVDNTFNVAVTADWGCSEDTKKTAENIQSKNPELVIAAGDLSYDESASCWFEIIEPFKSKMKIAMGDHEYSDTSGGAIGIINEYLKPLNLTKTYYSFDTNNVHVTFIDPFIDYGSTSDQYRFIEQDLRNASTNPKINWIFVVESKPIYTSPSKHKAESLIRDTYHPLFDKYGVDIVFTSDNHNYQRTFPLKYNSEGGDSSNPIIVDRNQTNYKGNNNGQIYLIVGTGGRSLYDIEEQAPFVAKQSHDHFGFLNIDINTNNTNNNNTSSLTATFYSNGNDDALNNIINENKNIIDQFTISKVN